jgi:hypothetical protein
LAYTGWTARKETNDKPAFHLHIELAENGQADAEQVAAAVHEELKKLDTPYAELEAFTDLRPLEVTLLPRNAFKCYKQKQQTSGADLAQLKPSHINPGINTIDFLVNTLAKVTAKAGEKVRG